MRVEISRYHDGQIVTPYCYAERVKNGWRLTSGWIDASYGTLRSYDHRERSRVFRSSCAAERWLADQGIRAGVSHA